MRLSLRTLLAFEDNIFDAEHRLQLERTIPRHDGTASTLRRIRSIVRHPHLGVPGIVDHREELDPNLTAEYLDHQLAAEHLDKFEAYCLSSDTYLAEVASVHQILSNVLGEPARTSRDCRLRCYDIGRPRAELTAFTESHRTTPPSADAPSVVPPSSAIAKPTSSKKQLSPWLLILLLVMILGGLLYWQRHQENKGKAEHSPSQTKDTEKGTLGADVPKVEPPPPQKSEAPKEEPKPAAGLEAKPEAPKVEPIPAAKPETKPAPPKVEPKPVAKPETKPEAPKVEPKPAAKPKAKPETPTPPLPTVPVPDTPQIASADSSSVDSVWGPIPVVPSSGFSSIGANVEAPSPKPALPPVPAPIPVPTLTPEESIPKADVDEAVSDWTFAPQSVEKPNPLRVESAEPTSSGQRNALLFDGVPLETETDRDVARQTPVVVPATTAAPSPIEFPERSRITFQQLAVGPSENTAEPVSATPTVWKTVPVPAVPPPNNEIVQAQDMWGKPDSLRHPALRGSEIRSTRYEETPPTPDQASATITFGENVQFVAEQENVKKPPPIPVMGNLLDSADPVVLFTASSANEQWKKSGNRIPLYVDQYLLTITPFRTPIELGGKFRIEMVGDAKLCILPLDIRGNPGIFIDYGRIVIRPLSNSSASLRIQTEKTSGLVTLGGRSLLFIDTFAEIVPTTPEPNVPLANATRKNNAILGLLPDPAESIAWFAENESQPFMTNAQTSVLLEKGRSDRGAIRHLPNWLQPVPLSDEGKMLVEVCQQAFDDARGNCEKALDVLSQSSSVPVRSFANRLWGDLGRFDVPLQLLAHSASEDEPVRQILAPYFREVMKRDAETVQRLADAIDAVRR